MDYLKELRDLIKLTAEELRPIIVFALKHRVIEARDILEPPRVFAIPQSSAQAAETNNDQIKEAADDVIIAPLEV